MDHYIDIQILPNIEIRSPIIMNMLFSQLHIVFVKFNDNIGISFPKYSLNHDDVTKSTLGDCLRLHGHSSSLTALTLKGAFSRFIDYVLISDVKAIPEHIDKFVVFQRKHTKAQRDIKRKQQYLLEKSGGEWNEQASESFRRLLEKLDCTLPFIQLNSQSTMPIEGKDSNQFKLFIQMSESKQQKGTFTKYGLSDPKARISVPIF